MQTSISIPSLLASLLLFSAAPKSQAQTANGKATKTRKGFSLEYTVSIDINASASAIWSHLTNASGYTTWNSTIKEFSGNIEEGGKVSLVSTDAPDRTFKLKVKDFQANEGMVWRDGFAPMFQGVRTFTLEPLADGKIRFTMSERFSGLMLPMIAGSLPDFTESFAAFASDLKKVSEKK